MGYSAVVLIFYAYIKFSMMVYMYRGTLFLKCIHQSGTNCFELKSRKEICDPHNTR